MNNLSTFTETLNDLMLENNINASDLAKALGLGTSTLSRYTRGERLPNIKCLIKLADYFKCSTDYLLGLEDDNYAQNFLPCPPFNERLSFLLNYFNRTSFSVYNNTNISEARFYVWKNGTGLPTVDNLINLAQIFGCSVDFVIGRSNA